MFVLSFDWRSAALSDHALAREVSQQIEHELAAHPADILHPPYSVSERSTGSAVFRRQDQLEAFIRGPLACVDRIPGAELRHHVHQQLDGLVDEPIVIISAPRSGSTLLFELMMELPEVVTLGGESFHVIDAVPELSLGAHGYRSHALTRADASEEIVALLRAGFGAGLRCRDGRPVLDPGRTTSAPVRRFVEKTPRNCLRVPFLRRVLPDARFVFLVREPRATISSIMEKWRLVPAGGHNVTLPGWSAGECWPENKWLGLVPEGWPALDGRPLVEIAAFKWASANREILAATEQLPRDRFTVLRFDELLAEPVATMERLCAFAGLRLDPRARRRCTPPLAPSASVVSAPSASKWRRDEDAIAGVLPSLRDLIDRLESRLGRFEVIH